jgi:hypothetical protein
VKTMLPIAMSDIHVHLETRHVDVEEGRAAGVKDFQLVELLR